MRRKNKQELDLTEQLDKMYENTVKRNPEMSTVPKPNSLRVMHNGNFTVALINEAYVGVSKFNPHDKRYREEEGVLKAMARALKQYLVLTANKE